MSKPSDGSAHLTVRCIGATAFRRDVRLICSLYRLLQPSYDDPASLLARELATCNRLYLGERCGHIQCFFLVAWDWISTPDRRFPAAYMGLSGTSQETKSSGLVRRLYAAALRDSQNWEGAIRTPVVAWATTASPSSYAFARRLLMDVQPRPNGDYDTTAAATMAEIRRFKGLPDALEHPFVVRRLAGDTRYSRIERVRIERVMQKKGFRLFDELNVNESEGDRLLVVGKASRLNDIA